MNPKLTGMNKVRLWSWEHAVHRGINEPQWFCLQTKPFCECLATVNLFNKQVTVFNPQLEEFYVRDGSHCQRVVPLFPGYIFANLVLAQDYYKVKWTQGVKKIVGHGDCPVPVADSVIYTILDRLENKTYIEIKKPKLGDKVVVKKGAFADLTGIFESSCPGDERVKVLLKLLGQQVSVELDYTSIRKL